MAGVHQRVRGEIEYVGFFFNNLLINPMLNILVMLYTVLFSNFGVALIVLP